MNEYTDNSSTKMDATEEYTGIPNNLTEDDVSLDYQRGYADAMLANAALNRTLDKRTAELINQLYHDRARLEKVISNHLKVLTFYGDDTKIEFVDKVPGTERAVEFQAYLQAFYDANGG